MKRFTAFLLFIIALPAAIYAQSGQLSGTIKNASNGESQFGITIMLEDASRGAKTDFEGKYTLDKLHPGTYTFVFSGMGFTKKIISGVKIENGKTTVLDVAIEEFIAEGE